MKNLPIIGKFLIITAAFGLFVLAVIAYASAQIWKIDANYSALVANQMDAAANTARANRALQTARAAISDLIMAENDKDTQNATKELAGSQQAYSTYMDVSLKDLPADADLSKLKADGLQVLEQACKGAIASGLSTNADDTAKAYQIYLADCKPQFLAISDRFKDITSRLDADADRRNIELTAISNDTVYTTVAIVIAGLLVVAVGGILGMRAWVVRPVNTLSGIMVRLANGDLETEVTGTDRRDEVGHMAKAVGVFKENGLKNRALEQEANVQRDRTEEQRRRSAETDRQRAEAMAKATDGLAGGLKHLSEGDLTFQLTEPFAPDFEGLRSDFNAAVTQLADTLASVAQATSQIDSGTSEISQSAQDLSKRTEQQAASLEETAAALDQITANVANSSKRAEEARSAAKEATASAAHSGMVVANAVGAMQRIEQSSHQIASIIGVIDEIAFQTNLLALNAGVEAARAGEAGKGFAVVAQEVRELAPRSAQAAKEIKDLIRNSSGQVQNGVQLVSETGAALKAIETSIVVINQHMDAIATSAREQSVGLSEVNTAVNQMDQVTQQNAAMVEESTAASATLAGEAGRLRSLIGQFRLRATSTSIRPVAAPVAAKASSHQPVPSPVRKLAGRLSQAFGGAAAAKGSWEEF